ncbi:hypothetical protein [Streptomyces sp. 7-21]|uniref:hypothetical protein n=1 Tax=Streptomyces sp. 7-21 TaxID=2802283 RepID=UPI00191D08D2|nr:hypothetical protein [Streptomyces sp. 7-21]MBL1067237.1 hypothetical protein [Streptomyces sp. 7-21]
MRSTKAVRRASRNPVTLVEDDVLDEAEEPEGDVVRVVCRDCRQPVALTGQDQSLPEHALCPTPWDPFGLTVCPGSGRAVAGEEGALPLPAAAGGEDATRASLPESLDWRLQPFSHAGLGPRPLRAPRLRQAA